MKGRNKYIQHIIQENNELIYKTKPEMQGSLCRYMKNTMARTAGKY